MACLNRTCHEYTERENFPTIFYHHWCYFQLGFSGKNAYRNLKNTVLFFLNSMLVRDRQFFITLINIKLNITLSMGSDSNLRLTGEGSEKEYENNKKSSFSFF